MGLGASSYVLPPVLVPLPLPVMPVMPVAVVLVVMEVEVVMPVLLLRLHVSGGWQYFCVSFLRRTTITPSSQ